MWIVLNIYQKGTSPSSSSSSTLDSSSSWNNRAVNSKSVDETTESFDSTIVQDMSALQGKKYQKDQDEREEFYSMDDIWKDITSDEPIKPVCDVYRERGNFNCPPLASSLWEYCPETLWRVGGDESKIFFSTNDQFVSCYQHEHMSLTG